MKNLLIIIIASFLIIGGCKVENNTNPPAQSQPTDPTNPTDPPADPPVKPTTPKDPPPPEGAKPFTMVATGPNGMKFYDGSSWTVTTYDKRATSKKYMRGDQIFTLDGYSREQSFTYTPEAGDIVRETSNGTYLCDVMTKAESFAGGALAKVHSQIWHYNGSVWAEVGDWWTRQWECADIFETESGEIIIKDTPLGRIYSMTGLAVFSAQDNGLMITNYDGVNKRANFTTKTGTTTESWIMNYMSSAKDWVELGGTYYSYNGYEYSPGSGLIVTNALTGFQTAPYPISLPNGEMPTMVALGSDSAIGVVYFVEANSGWLVEYRAGTNQLSITKRLYIGDGMKQSGLLAAKKLKPYLAGGIVYFNHGGSVLYLDINTGGAGVFMAEDGFVRGF